MCKRLKPELQLHCQGTSYTIHPVAMGKPRLGVLTLNLEMFD